MKNLIIILAIVFLGKISFSQENKIPVTNFLELSTGLNTKGTPNLNLSYWINFDKNPRWNLNFSFLIERDFEELVLGGSYSFLKSKDFYNPWDVSFGINVGDCIPSLGRFCSRFFLREEIQIFEWKNYHEQNSCLKMKKRPINAVFYQTVCSDWKGDTYFRFNIGLNMKIF